MPAFHILRVLFFFCNLPHITPYRRLLACFPWSSLTVNAVRPVFIFTSSSSALLGRPRCALSIWLSLLAVFNTLFWVYANLFVFTRKRTKHENTSHVWYQNSRGRLLGAQSSERAPLNSLMVCLSACLSSQAILYWLIDWLIDWFDLIWFNFLILSLCLSSFQ